jgi:fibronectin-binding autotransporter adhesin
MKTTQQTHLAIALALSLVPALAPAANLTWDANPALTGAQDGSGTWDTVTNTWWTGSANALWSSTTPDFAFFGAANGTAGTVTLGANIVSGNIRFNAPSVGNYVITGGSTLGLTNRGIYPTVNATINATIVGGSITLNHGPQNAPSGLLTLSGNNTSTGTFTIGENANNPDGQAAPNTTCAVRATSGTAFGAATIAFNGQGNLTSPRLELAGGITLSNPVTFGGRNNPSDAIIAVSGANTMLGVFTGSTGGQNYALRSEAASGLTISNLAMNTTGTRNFVLGGSGSGAVNGLISGGVSTVSLVKGGSGTWTLRGANTYVGVSTVGAGTLTLDYAVQNNSKLPDAGLLNLAGGTLNLSGGSHLELVGSNSIAPGGSYVTRSSGTSSLRLNVINRSNGGVVDFAVASLADTDTLNVNGILGGYATVGGADWAFNSTGAGDGAITAYSGYTDIAATGSTIADGSGTNVRLNSAGSGGNISLGAATTTVNTLLQNTTSAATIDTASGILRLGATGGVLVPGGKLGLTLGTAANAGTLTAGGADNTAGEIILINNSGNAVTVNSTIADNGTGPVSFTKAGSGSATLAGANTHSGTNNIVGGTLNVSADSNLGATPGGTIPNQIILNGGTLNATASFTLDSNRGMFLGSLGANGYNGGTISVASGQSLTYGGIIAGGSVNSAAGFLTTVGPGSLTKTGNGTLILGGASTYAGSTFINGGTISVTADNNLGGTPSSYTPDSVVLNGGILQAAGTFTLSANRGVRLGPVGASGSGSILVDAGQILTFNGQISDNWNGSGALTMSGDGTLVLGGSVNDYSGNTTVSGGVLQINNSRAIPNGAGKGNLLLNNNTLNINGVNVALNGLTGTGTVDNNTGTAMTLSLGNNDQTASFGGTIQNTGGGALALSKAGSGTVTLTGAANHTGSTLVTAGTLALSGSASISTTTNIAVSSGATLNVSGLTGGTLTLNSGQMISGSGTVLGTINTGSGALAPGASAGTLSVANLTLGSGSSLNYELANVTTLGGGTNDLTVVTGNLEVAGPVTLNLSYLNAIPAGIGKYILITYGGTFSGNVTDITVPSGFAITNNASAKAIELLINHTPSSIVWVGNNGGVWDTATANWSSADNLFYNGDSPRFDDSATTAGAISISSPVIAGAVIVSNTVAYNFTGSSLSAGSLTKQNSGTLTIENDTSLSGALISGGTVQIGNAGSTGTIAAGNITNNAALIANRADALTIGSPISGTGTFTQAGTGVTSLTASNSYTGLTTVSAGAIQVANGSALGATSAGTVVSGGAQVFVNLNVNIGDESLSLAGDGPATDGALRKGGGGVSIYGGAVTLTADARIKLDGGATLNLTNANGISSSGQNLLLTGDNGSVGIVAGPINLGGGAGILTKTGGSSWTLGGSNSMSLAAVDGGTLVLANNNALGTNLDVVLSSTTGGAGLSGTRLTLSGGVSFPVNRTLSMPSSGAGTVRSAFFGTGAGVTNIWAGPVILNGDGDPASFLGFGADAGSTFIISGNVTAPTFAGKLLVRGSATGVGHLLGSVALNASTGGIQVDDGSTWVIGSAANTWATTVFAGSSTIQLAVNNGLPTSTVLTVGNGLANRFDLAGFNQQVADMNIPGGGLLITNSSATFDSTFTYSSAGTASFGGLISDGARKLNLTVAAGNLTLTNPATLNLTKSTVSVASGGAALQLDYDGTNTVAGLVLGVSSKAPGLYNNITDPTFILGTGNLLVANPVATNPTNITFSASGGNLTLTWPSSHTGWTLQAQTNTLGVGLSTNWSVYNGGFTTTNSAVVPIGPAMPTVFFRLKL